MKSVEVSEPTISSKVTAICNVEEFPERYTSEPADRARLAEPLTFHFASCTVPNRFMKASLTEQLCTYDPGDHTKSGIPTRNIERLYERWGRGGIGLILSGTIVTSLADLESIGFACIPPDAPFSGPRFNSFAAMARAGQVNGSLMIAQVNHSGQRCVFPDSPLSGPDMEASNKGEGNDVYKHAKPHTATHEEIKDFINAYGHAAEYLAEAGWDGIQLHGGHGYLIAQFLSPKSNKRNDEYGGSMANRMRLLLEIGREVRRRTPPNFILGIKVNSVEFQNTGFTAAEARVICQNLERETFDFVEITGGSYENVALNHERRDSTKKREAFFLEFANQLILGLTGKTKVYVTGGLRTVGGMVRTLDSVDGVGLARPLFEEWFLCKDIMEGKVDGSIIPYIPQTDFALFLMAGNRNMRLVGMGKEPEGLWKREVVNKLRAGYPDWITHKILAKEVRRYHPIED